MTDTKPNQKSNDPTSKTPNTGSLEKLVPNQSDVIYHLDQVIIYSRKSKDTLEQQLPIEGLKELCCRFTVQRAKGGYLENGWNSCLNCIVPSDNFCILLQKHKSTLGSYIISKVEVAKDILTPSLSLSELDGVVRNIYESLSISYAKTGEDFDVMRKHFKELAFYVPDKGGITIYLANKAWTLVIYARRSKLTGENCIHAEWRYLNASSVKQKLGIRTIENLIDFDYEKHWKLKGRSITLLTIDRQLLGKFYLEIDGRRKLDQHIGDSNSKRMRCTYGKVMLMAAHLLSGIKTIADFKKMISDWKAEIKQKSGKRSSFEEKILKVNASRFLKPLDISNMDD